MYFSAVALTCVAIVGNALHRHNPALPQRTLHRRNYFYAGGSFVQRGSSTLVHGQMYVEHLSPIVITQRFPLLFIGGHGMTGTNLLNTPDGRRGWADYFLSRGYEVHILYCGIFIGSSEIYI